MRYGAKTLIVSLAGTACVLGVLPAGTAAAGTLTSLPITNFHQIVADTAHGHLFISQGSSSSADEILVTNLAGQEVAEIAGQDGVTGIALSPDGSTLYAALATDHAVTAIDTTTLEQTASYPLGDTNTPVDVAVQSGKVWVSYNTGTSGASIGDIDLTAAQPAFETQAAMGPWSVAPELAADPQDTGVLVAAEPAVESPAVASYDVAVDPVTVRAQSGSFANCENLGDLAVAPGGAEFVLACGFPYAHDRYSTADLSQQGSYPSETYPVAVAFDASGVVAAGTGNDASDPDLYVYQPDATTPLNILNLNGPDGGLVARGLAWAPDGSQLFAVLETSPAAFTLDVVSSPTLTQSTLSLSGPSSADVTKKVTLTGSLALSTGSAPATGTPVAITRSLAGSTSTATFNVTTAASGGFTVTDTPPGPGKYTYTASYSGSATIAAATASQVVTVSLLPVSLSLSTGASKYTYEPTVHLTAHLGTTYKNRTVSIYAQPAGAKARKLLKTAKVNARGEVTVSYKAPHNTKFSAVFSGDARYAAKTVTRTVEIRARVAESLSSYYSSERLGRITYRLYHRSALLHSRAVVSPNKHGECVEFEAEEYYQGTWYGNTATGCAKLTKSSKAYATFNLTHADIGFHYRIRADYIRSSKDTTNLSSDGPWLYFIVER